MKIEKFEDIKSWQESRALVRLIYQAVQSNSNFTSDIRFKSQITSSAISVMPNIAEGFSRNSNKEFVRFLFISKGSLAEVQSQLYTALDIGYISEEKRQQIYEKTDLIARLLSKFITYLKYSSN